MGRFLPAVFDGYEHWVTDTTTGSNLGTGFSWRLFSPNFFSSIILLSTLLAQVNPPECNHRCDYGYKCRACNSRVLFSFLLFRIRIPLDESVTRTELLRNTN
ncbi:hypothetical protein AVEN_264305-1 [Araneus ventricosus]|uniref:Uncharacterized protein n=1 Tax=Araneus ventricosus TaxID=182803 RepID=A0A4Y2E0P1_ARAVE|nr:hypothetical protein AVEN_264305-1 [Araneus ventricosus]